MIFKKKKKICKKKLIIKKYFIYDNENNKYHQFTNSFVSNVYFKYIIL